jgi:hypothetical protein
MFARLSAVFVFYTASLVVAAPAVTVKLDGATVTGKTSGFVEEYLGIPFAQPP